VRLTRQENDQAFTLAAPRVKVRIDKQTGAVSFLDAADHVLLREAPRGVNSEPATIAGAPVTSCAQSFETARMKAFTAWASISAARGIMRGSAAASGSPKPTWRWGFR
jgi:hypothetical protein